jgi:sugar transferase (PEP-CTERM/EpsH1 system associated)
LKILFLTHRLPYAPNRGDRIRSYYMLREMSRFADVSLISLAHDRQEAAMAAEVPFARHVTALRVTPVRNAVRGVSRLWSTAPLTHSLLDAPGLWAAVGSAVASQRPDVAVAYCSGMARLALHPALAHVPFVLDMVDVDSAKWARLAAASHGLRRWIYRREARTLREFEIGIVAKARTTLVVNESERELLTALAPGARVVPIGLGIDVEAFAPSGAPPNSSQVVFSGVMNYAPNVNGVMKFAKEIWPLVRARRPDARFVIVGADPTRDVRALAVADPSIEITGGVPAVQPYLWNAALSIAPLWLTQGLQNKVLEALAAKLPVVITPQVSAGLPVHARAGCVVATSPAEFAAAVLQFLAATPEQRRHHAESARLNQLTWSVQLEPLEPILRGEAAKQRLRA